MEVKQEIDREVFQHGQEPLEDEDFTEAAGKDEVKVKIKRESDESFLKRRGWRNRLLHRTGL